MDTTVEWSNRRNINYLFAIMHCDTISATRLSYITKKPSKVQSMVPNPKARNLDSNPLASHRDASRQCRRWSAEALRSRNVSCEEKTTHRVTRVEHIDMIDMQTYMSHRVEEKKINTYVYIHNISIRLK